MTGTTIKPLPLWRMLAYVAVFVGCGAVAMHELYYAVAGSTTTGTIVSIVKMPGAGRSARFRSEYAFIDEQGVQHTAVATGIHPLMRIGDAVEVQYLRHAPESSRLAPSPAAGLCYGSVALFAAIVFAGEWIVRRRARPRGRATGG